MLQVTELQVLENYILFVKLSDGTEGEFDVKPYLDKGIFTELRSPQYFPLVKITFGGIMWPNLQDFSTDTIHQEIKQ
jgi:hypothetical protein